MVTVDVSLDKVLFKSIKLYSGGGLEIAGQYVMQVGRESVQSLLR